jgi:hypothetical protein
LSNLYNKINYQSITKEVIGSKSSNIKEDKVDTEKLLSIKDICRLYGLSDMRVRAAIRKGQFKTTLGLVSGTKTPKHYAKPVDVENWRKASTTHTKRMDGRNKYSIYATKEEKEVLDRLLSENKLSLPLNFANRKKVEVE